jgi:lysyl-tRNA synthetase class I
MVKTYQCIYKSRETVSLNYSNKRSLCLSASSKMPVKKSMPIYFSLLNVLLNIKYKNKRWKPCFRLEFRNVHSMQHFTNLQLCWNILCGFGFKVRKNCLQPKLAIKNDNFEIHQKLRKKVKFSNIFLSYFVNFWRTNLKPFKKQTFHISYTHGDSL